MKEKGVTVLYQSYSNGRAWCSINQMKSLFVAKLWATLVPFISNKCTFAYIVFINECSDCLEYGLLESNNSNWMKNERTRNYSGKARQYLSLWLESVSKALYLQCSMYLFWVKIKELLIEFTICKALGYIRIGDRYPCIVSSKSHCVCGLEFLVS